MSQVYHVMHESHNSSPDSGYPGPYPPPPQLQVPGPAPPGYGGYPHGHGGYQGYFHGRFSPPSAAPPPLRPYNYNNYGSIGCSSLIRGCLAALCCCCVLDECCF